jgi:hypothetical protein
VTIDGGDDGERRRVYGLDRFVESGDQAFRAGDVEASEYVNVHARGERAPAPGDDRDAHRRIGGEAAEGVAERTDELGLEEVEWRPIERTTNDAAVTLDRERGGHAQ